jgi:tRNA G10  N-methylase Trm11
MVTREMRGEQSLDPLCGTSIFAAECRKGHMPAIGLGGPIREENAVLL